MYGCNNKNLNTQNIQENHKFHFQWGNMEYRTIKLFNSQLNCLKSQNVFGYINNEIQIHN